MEGARLVDVGDSWVLPSAVDAPVHSYSYSGEGLEASTSLFDTDSFRCPRISDAELLDATAAIGAAGSTLCAHVENNEIIKALLADERNRSSTDPRVHGRTRPPVSETLGALTAMEVSAHQGNAMHLCHLSLGGSAARRSWWTGTAARASRPARTTCC